MKSLANFFLKQVKGRYINPIKYSHLKIEIDCKSRWYGNQYVGFYLNPSSINENSVVYSFGIGGDISFDKEIIDTHKCHVYGFDPTPKPINWCKNIICQSVFIFAILPSHKKQVRLTSTNLTIKNMPQEV